MRFKILCVAGARPNFIKVAPLMRALGQNPAFEARLVHTGQHYDDKMSRVFFEELGIPRPDVELEVGSGTHGTRTAEIIRRFEPILQAEQPHAVLVVGDVNSTIGCALAASKFVLREPFATRLGQRRRPLIVHVEAGLRSFDRDMPEEINRLLTDCISDLLFVSDPAGLANLHREGQPEARCFYVGNVMIDTLLAARARAKRSEILSKLGLYDERFLLLTLHRPANVDDPRVLSALLCAVNELAPELPVAFPVHPRTRARLDGALLDPARWRLIEPVGYLDFLQLLASARAVLTDSGGIQEETTVLGVPCVTLRDTTERPVTVTHGTNVLAGTRPERIAAAFREATRRARPEQPPRFWDGKSAMRIARILTEMLRP